MKGPFKNFEFIPHQDYEKQKERISGAVKSAADIYLTERDKRVYEDYLKGISPEAREIIGYSPMCVDDVFNGPERRGYDGC